LSKIVAFDRIDITLGGLIKSAFFRRLKEKRCTFKQKVYSRTLRYTEHQGPCGPWCSVSLSFDKQKRKEENMTVFGINGSPRKKWNTSTLLMKSLEGAASQGADTELIHLYDLDYKGCKSCFACKIIDGPHNGKCALKDDLSLILKRIEKEADAIIIGTPIYFGSMTGEMRSFLERLLFPMIQYSQPFISTFPRKINTAVIYTMNATEKMSHERSYEVLFNTTETYLRMVFGEAETFCCYDTDQFPDYSKVIMEYYDPAKKAERRKEVFPDDCRKAFALGCRLYS
jgi:multimeric flavodoxin WrbA